MVERICPRCETGNLSTNAYCGQCGTPLEGQVQLPARRPSSALARVQGSLPVRWRETGRVVALGVAAVAAEVGMAVLAQRQQRARGTAIVPLRPTARPTSGRVIAIARRVHETWRGGELVQRSDEQVMWIVRDENVR